MSKSAIHDRIIAAMGLAVIGGTVLSATAAHADDPIGLRRARSLVVREAVERANAFTVRIDTVGGVQPRADGVEIVPGDTGGDEDQDGIPDDVDTPFRDTLGDRFTVADGPTTGIIYEPDGWILASSFNFVRDPSYITVQLSDGQRFVANLVARDRVRKIALLKIDADDLPTAEWVPTDEIHVGQWAIALGRGFGADEPSVSVGVVSARNRMMGNAIQTDAKLSPANYGGPLIDIHGRVLGICVPMAQWQGELAGVRFYDAGVGFAVPVERVRDIVEVLKQGRSVYRGWLGLQVNTRSKEGLEIRAVGDPSPVHSLGIKPGDMIVYANGREVRNFTHLRQAIYMVPAGEPVQLVIRHNNVEYGYEVVLARSEELGGLLSDAEPDFDPDDPFPLPHPNTWP